MKYHTLIFIPIFVLSMVILSCDGYPELDDSMLDGDIVFDPSINNPELYLVSAKYPNPSPDDLEKHIIIAVHGYTATTFEWSEFAEWSTSPEYRVSQVLLGGHGTTYDDFKASKWEDWAESIQLEYEALEALGYTKISLVGSSTGGALLLELVRSGYFETRISPKNIFLIDTIVLPSVKLQSIAGIVGPMLVYVETDQTTEEDKYWYRFRPHETIDELNELITTLRKGLEKGFKLPQGTYLKVFHSKHDPTANSLSSVLIYKGLKTASGNKIDVKIMDSDIHVFTRLKLRENVSQKQRDNQQSVFSQIAQRLSE